MKILMISSDRNILEQGSTVYARQRRYAEALGELHIIVLTTGNHRSIHDGPLHIYSTNSRARWAYGLGALRIARTIAHPDIITTQDPFEIGLLGLVISRMLRVPLHAQIHTDFLSPVFAQHSSLNRLRVLVAGVVLRRATRIRVVAPRIKEEIEARYHPRVAISVLPIFVDTARFHTVRHKQHPRFEISLLFVGRLEPEKRADIAIRSLSRVRALGVDAGLTIVGDGSLRTQLQSFAQKQGVAECVEFVGRQDPPPHYAHADIVLVPSSYEGYGLVIVEALAAGVPVLATDVGIAEEAGAIIAPHGGDGFTGVLCSLFARPELPKGRLKEYPYRSEEEYVEAWADDIRGAAV